MAETLVEKKVCGECGADVRPQTSFCYNCGKSVTETPDRGPAGEPSSVWFGETLISDEPEPVAEPEPELESEPEPDLEPEPDEDLSDAVTESWDQPLVTEPEPELEAAEEEHEKDQTEVLEPENNTAVDDMDPIHHSLPVESGMRSAASIRRKPKTFQRKEVEVAWEEYQGRSGLIYVLITLLVVLFTVIVFWMAMNMK